MPVDWGKKIEFAPSESEAEPWSVRLLGLTFWPAVPDSAADETYQLLLFEAEESDVTCWNSLLASGRTPVLAE